MMHRLTTDYTKNYCNPDTYCWSYSRKCSHVFFWDTVYILQKCVAPFRPLYALGWLEALH